MAKEGHLEKMINLVILKVFLIFQKHFDWLKRVEETAKDVLYNNKTNDIVVLPKTPAGKRTRKNRQAFETIPGKSFFF